jgi:hypothetical protein
MPDNFGKPGELPLHLEKVVPEQEMSPEKTA